MENHGRIPDFGYYDDLYAEQPVYLDRGNHRNYHIDFCKYVYLFQGGRSHQAVGTVGEEAGKKQPERDGENRRHL